MSRKLEEIPEERIDEYNRQRVAEYLPKIRTIPGWEVVDTKWYWAEPGDWPGEKRSPYPKFRVELRRVDKDAEPSITGDTAHIYYSTETRKWYNDTRLKIPKVEKGTGKLYYLCQQWGDIYLPTPVEGVKDHQDGICTGRAYVGEEHEHTIKYEHQNYHLEKELDGKRVWIIWGGVVYGERPKPQDVPSDDLVRKYLARLNEDRTGRWPEELTTFSAGVYGGDGELDDYDESD